MVNLQRQIVFFDLDGTLHQQNMFGTFIRYLIWRQPFNLLLLLPLLPVITIGFLIKGWTARWPMSLLLWSITFGHSETKFQRQEANFVLWFRQRVVAFPTVQQQLFNYLNKNTDVWLITGSPKQLVEQVYYDSTFLPYVKLIASKIERAWGGQVLSLRCLGQEKVIQLEEKIGIQQPRLYSGYSDSKQDNPLLLLCKYRWRVTPQGELQQLE